MWILPRPSFMPLTVALSFSFELDWACWLGKAWSDNPSYNTNFSTKWMIQPCSTLHYRITEAQVKEKVSLIYHQFQRKCIICIIWTILNILSPKIREWTHDLVFKQCNSFYRLVKESNLAAIETSEYTRLRDNYALELDDSRVWIYCSIKVVVKLSLFSALYIHWSSFPCEHGVYHFLASLRSWSSRASLKLRLLGYSNRPLRANDGGAKLLAAAARQELSSRVLYLHNAKWPFFALCRLAWLKYDNLDFTFSPRTTQPWNHYTLHDC